MAGSIAVFEYKANQIVDMGTPGLDWATDRFAADFDTAEEEPLATLKQEYVEGDISGAEFERRLDRLIENDVQRVLQEDRTR